MDRTGVLAEADKRMHTYTYVLRVACWWNNGPREAKVEWTLDGEAIDLIKFPPEEFLANTERDALEQVMRHAEFHDATPVFKSGEWVRDYWRREHAQD